MAESAYEIGAFHGRPYIVGEEPDAIPNGARVRKVREDGPGETPLGTGGFVLSSIDAREASEIALGLANSGVLSPRQVRPATHFYFVVWDTAPLLPVGVVDWKLEAAP